MEDSAAPSRVAPQELVRRNEVAVEVVPAGDGGQVIKSGADKLLSLLQGTFAAGSRSPPPPSLWGRKLRFGSPDRLTPGLKWSSSLT